MKKKFMNAEAELIRFETADVLSTSTREVGSGAEVIGGDGDDL